MRIQVKDEVTIPWISTREIPAVKLMLSAWRKLRRDPEARKRKAEFVSSITNVDSTVVDETAGMCAEFMEELALLHERVKKEKKNGKR